MNPSMDKFIDSIEVLMLQSLPLLLNIVLRTSLQHMSCRGGGEGEGVRFASKT
jgi:hypothetical protein